VWRTLPSTRACSFSARRASGAASVTACGRAPGQRLDATVWTRQSGRDSLDATVFRGILSYLVLTRTDATGVCSAARRGVRALGEGGPTRQPPESGGGASARSNTRAGHAEGRVCLTRARPGGCRAPRRVHARDVSS